MSMEVKEGETFGTTFRATVWSKSPHPRLWVSPTLGTKVSQTCLQRRSLGKDRSWQLPCGGLQPHLFFLLCRSIFFRFRIISYSFSRPACRPWPSRAEQPCVWCVVGELSSWRFRTFSTFNTQKKTVSRNPTVSITSFERCSCWTFYSTFKTAESQSGRGPQSSWVFCPPRQKNSFHQCKVKRFLAESTEKSGRIAALEDWMREPERRDENSTGITWTTGIQVQPSAPWHNSGWLAV